MNYLILSILSILSNSFPGIPIRDTTQPPQAFVQSRLERPAFQRDDDATALREAVTLLQTGKLDEAELIIRRVVAGQPRNADGHNLLGLILDQRRQFAEAEREYREALR
ncbi:MAG TPA: hypothetical protein VM095_00190, partial [Pyrinomonadaceae bacterium]|nr:hypothetical protein [Pyrinomonadaceae bacterium]